MFVIRLRSLRILNYSNYRGDRSRNRYDMCFLFERRLHLMAVRSLELFHWFFETILTFCVAMLVLYLSYLSFYFKTAEIKLNLWHNNNIVFQFIIIIIHLSWFLFSHIKTRMTGLDIESVFHPILLIFNAYEYRTRFRCESIETGVIKLSDFYAFY